MPLLHRMLLHPQGGGCKCDSLAGRRSNIIPFVVKTAVVRLGDSLNDTLFPHTPSNVLCILAMQGELVGHH